MASKPRRKKTENEEYHGHCADELMRDYGIAKEHRAAVCDEIHKIYKQNSVIHCVIIASVRGWQPLGITRGLEHYLSRLGTQSPKNRKPEPHREQHSSGHFDSQGNYRPH